MQRTARTLAGIVAGLALTLASVAPAAGAGTASGPEPGSVASRAALPEPHDHRHHHRCKHKDKDTVADVAADMQPGWNLGNSFDATGADETSWGNPRVTEELLDQVRAQGFNSIRIPVTWGQHQGGAPDHTIDQAYLDRVEEVVGWALEDGFYVLINIHHDSWQWVNTMPTNHDAVLDRYTDTWTQIADRFRGADGRLLFESVNEPQFTGSSGEAANLELLAELNDVFHGVVRGSGGGNATRPLVLPTLNTGSEPAKIDALATQIAALDDPNLIATVHYYGFWPFSVNIAGYTRFDAEVQQDVTDTFDRVHTAFVARGVPVLLGEYGLLGFDRHTGTVEQGEKLKFFEYLGYAARERGITTMLWDNGQHFDRTAHTWQDTALFEQIESSWTERSGTASSDLVFVPASGAVGAQSLTLSPNGTSFEALLHDGEELAAGTDYTVTGDRLTLSAALLQRLAGDRTPGPAGELVVRFSGGVPWTVRVINQETPVLRDASGTTAAFAIPTSFTGDLLATMEARYADGSVAGPQSWTSYKEFDVTFAPDYGAGTITLTPEFFAEVHDGTVHLTFHFWSGDTVQYTLTRTGSTVTGT
ncbi:Aryl-phospho-beta-D-glucosidase BglC, GH1 family [Promicromonospora umidemergens]|uniref:Cellulase family glycosylhydrolase n=1 Tax=Promicromonospora umidemergens TaxID=629679 RepID=A0ABP8XV52_9MICO|nr:cellulase family glycosylhydrolase [Promicromonospora umidemergens]MCP2285265.1 Aryl-phospho-beta-D-glucosidase BglC, GH1 family [Promicromonospora umidemergens]